MAESGSWKKITIHTDGGRDGNPGPGGWAALLRHGNHVRELTGGETATINNRMELQAAISALKSLKEK
jgi:ribonuclease HI